jgi:hypothetical protein
MSRTLHSLHHQPQLQQCGEQEGGQQHGRPRLACPDQLRAVVWQARSGIRPEEDDGPGAMEQHSKHGWQKQIYGTRKMCAWQSAGACRLAAPVCCNGRVVACAAAPAAASCQCCCLCQQPVRLLTIGRDVPVPAKHPQRGHRFSPERPGRYRLDSGVSTSSTMIKAP